MTDGRQTDAEGAERALAGHGAFAREDEAFTTSTTAADARITVEETGDGTGIESGSETGAVYHVTVRVPTIDSVVAGETVAQVVREGWFETFERRLEDVGGATVSDPAPPTAEVDETADEVVVRTTVEPGRPGGGADDVKAVVDYVEGTFVEGLIPGYTYREPAAGLLDRARSSGQR